MEHENAVVRVAQIRQHWNAGTLQPSWQWTVERAYDDVGVLLAALTAAAAERDEWKRLEGVRAQTESELERALQRAHDSYRGARDALGVAETERKAAEAQMIRAHMQAKAAEAERDQARADLKSIADRLCREDEEYAAKVAAAEAERDQYRDGTILRHWRERAECAEAQVSRLEAAYCEDTKRVAAYDLHATRLAALEQAARAWGIIEGREWLTRDRRAHERDLLAAVAALPGESP